MSRGMACCLTVVLLWGLQPFFMKAALIEFDAYTISWFRLTGACVLLLCMSRARWKEYLYAMKPNLLPLFATGLCLAVNYFTFIKGIDLGGPITAGVTIQVGPVLLALVGVVWFRERLARLQILGVIVASLGFFLFFKERLGVASITEFQADAVGIVIISAIFWVGYCIGQKMLGSRVGVNAVNLAAYLFSALLLSPFTTLPESHQILTASFAAMIYLSISTTVAYWALGEAIRLVPVSIVSLCIVTNPIVTIVVVEILLFFGNIFFEPYPLTGIGYLGTCIALVGVAIAVAKRTPRISRLEIVE